MAGAQRTDRTSIHEFPSALGWIALAWKQGSGKRGTLLELTFGHDSPQQARRALTTPPDEGADGEPPDIVPRLQAYARGERVDFSDVQVAASAGGPFAQKVVEQCRKIPFGQTRTYGQVAALAGSPRAARAVGNAMAVNRTPLVVPCHRVVAGGGRPGGYSACEGQRTKLRLLEMEALGKPAVELVKAVRVLKRTGRRGIPRKAPR